jgi:DNA-binding CsgD family transcriptional regulator/PAS domain-containing protein
MDSKGNAMGVEPTCIPRAFAGPPDTREPTFLAGERRSAHPIALVNVQSAVFIDANDRLVALIGLPAVRRGVGLQSVLRNAGEVRRGLELLRDGAVDAYLSRWSLRTPEGRDIEPAAWVRIADDSRDVAIVTLSTDPIVDDVDTVALDDVGDVAVGHLDADLTVCDVTDGITAILGWTTEEWSGKNLLDSVHPADVPRVSRAMLACRPFRVHVRLRDRRSGFRGVQLLLLASRLGADGARPRWDLVISPVGSSGGSVAHHRAEALEHHLGRIAQELRLAGVIRRTPSPSGLHATANSELSHRQREIVRCLLRGLRVPTIARTMYLSPSTVRNHLAAAYQKLGVASQEELMQLFLNDDAS